jgi:hypothetical protein
MHHKPCDSNLVNENRLNDLDESPKYLDRPVWGATAIGREINRTERQVHHLLAKGLIKSARRIGGRWCASPAALRREFGG